MKKKILIFPAGTEIAFEVLNALKYSKFVELIGGNSVPSHAEMVFENVLENFPNIDDDNFVPFLNKAIEDYDIDYIYPAHDSVCLKLTQLQNEIKAKVVTSSLNTVEICRSKIKTYEYLKDEYYIPTTYKEVETIKSFPVFIKPTVGQGSQGAKLVKSKDELIRLLAENREEYVICEYLSGEEYTIDCFTDRHGKLRVAFPRVRERIRNGIAVRSKRIFNESKLFEIAERINAKFDFNGAWFFQVKKNNEGEYKLLEISPRIPGTMGVSRNTGVNFPLLTLYNIWGYDIDILENGDEDILLDRAFISRYKTNIEFEKVYIDFDDTLYLGNKVNLTIIMFLYQCVNKGKKIILITKHEKDILNSLKELRISKELFDEIILIEKNDQKYKYIDANGSIFIDDSFAERKMVKEKVGIAVFDLDMIESLIDWRM